VGVYKFNLLDDFTMCVLIELVVLSQLSLFVNHHLKIVSDTFNTVCIQVGYNTTQQVYK